MTQTNSFIMTCPKCKTRNRIPKERVGLVAKCGKCREDIQTDILNISDRFLERKMPDFDIGPKNGSFQGAKNPLLEKFLYINGEVRKKKC